MQALSSRINSALSDTANSSAYKQLQTSA